jgi:acyl dehydratase
VPDSQLFFDDLAVGDSAPPRSHTLTRTDLVKYAGASGDYNPMHHDDVQAKEVGLPSVFGHGMLSAGMVATALTDYVGVGRLTRYKVRFAKQTWPGDVLTTAVTVTGKRAEGDRNLVDFDCQLANQDGVAVVVGEATAELPARAS